MHFQVQLQSVCWFQTQQDNRRLQPESLMSCPVVVKHLWSYFFHSKPLSCKFYFALSKHHLKLWRLEIKALTKLSALPTLSRFYRKQASKKTLKAWREKRKQKLLPKTEGMSFASFSVYSFLSLYFSWAWIPGHVWLLLLKHGFLVTNTVA